MAHYTTVADTILCDMISAKSKLTDISYLVYEYAYQLKQVGILNELNSILSRPPYTIKDLENKLR